MTDAAQQTVADFSALLKFLSEALEASDAQGLAQRIGVSSSIRVGETPTPLDRWQATLHAALRANRGGRFVEEASLLVGEADKDELRKVLGAATAAHMQRTLQTGHPELGSIASGLIEARSLGGLNVAARACRNSTVRILAAMEVGSPQRATLLVVDNSTDVQHVADRITTLALNALTAVDRLLDLTDNVNSPTGISLHVPKLPDDLDRNVASSTDDPQILTLARNARNATYQQLQRLLAELDSSSVGA